MIVILARDINELGREAARYFEYLQGRICTVVEDPERHSGENEVAA